MGMDKTKEIAGEMFEVAICNLKEKRRKQVFTLRVH